MMYTLLTLVGAALLGTHAPGREIEQRVVFEANSLDGWIAREDGWHSEAGEVIHGDPHFHGGVLALPQYRMDSIHLAAEAYIRTVYWDPDTVWAGLLIHAPNPVARGPWDGGYLFLVRANGEAVLVKAGGATLATVDTAVRPREGFVRMAIAAAGGRIRCYVGNDQIIEVEDEEFHGGEIALVHFGNEAAFRNVFFQGKTLEPVSLETVTPSPPTPVRQPPVTPLAAVGVRKTESGGGEFYLRDTGHRFTPKGFNHVVLEHGATGWHALFNVGVYDAEAVEKVLTAMAALGANTLRVWAWGVQNATGFTGASESQGLNGAYMENFVDFLRRATVHGIYIIPILDETPHNAYYDAIAAHAEAEAETGDLHITGYTMNYLSPGPLAAKRAAVLDFVGYVKEADPGLLTAVLGWAFANEVFVNHSEGPFHREEGIVVTSTGRPYDMADHEQRQACYDETIVHWSNTLADAVKEVAPEALTTVGLWTSDAHGRPPLNYLLPDEKDPRRPPRPSTLTGAKSRLDFLDIHIYPWDGTSTVRPEAHELDALKAGGKPVIVGEYGVFKNKRIEEARVMMGEMLAQSFAMGYQGALHWVWDMTGVQGQTWSAVEHDLGAYLMALDYASENE